MYLDDCFRRGQFLQRLNEKNRCESELILERKRIWQREIIILDSGFAQIRCCQEYLFFFWCDDLPDFR